MVIGLLGAVLVRVVLIRAGLDLWIRPRGLAYPALAIAITLTVHLLFFSA